MSSITSGRGRGSTSLSTTTAGEHEATGTSLAAIVFIAAFAAAVQGAYGNVHVLDGVLIGIPAVGGVLLGTWLQQRLDQRVIALLFAALLVVTAVELLLQ